MSKEKTAVRCNLTIELRSDLCPGSGFDHAGVIDSDVCTDDYGLPYIPARRLKGCFRESAENFFGLDRKTVEHLFGKRGDDGAKGFVIKNAYPEHYSDLTAALETIRLDTALQGLSGEKAAAKGQKYNPEQVLRQFTSVRAQTRLEEGVAEQETLRYTRVIDCRNSILDGNVKFYSDVFCDPEDYDLLEKIVKATKSIGMHRNRGLGSVRCTLCTCDNAGASSGNHHETADAGAAENRKSSALARLVWQAESGGEEMSGSSAGAFDESIRDDRKYELTFTVKDTDPLEISADSDNRSLTYINGNSVRGCLAANFLRMTKGMPKEAQTAAFETVFLSDTVFNNLYPSEGGRAYYPAPFYLRRLKKTKDLVNVIAADDRETDGDAGNRPQKIKNGYIHIEHGEAGYSYAETETAMELQFHHRTEKEDEALLYTLETIAPGQYFTGSVITGEAGRAVLKELIEKGMLSFGKSKAAQYGKCALIGRVKEREWTVGSDENDAREEIVLGSRKTQKTVRDTENCYVILFASDALIRSDVCGDFTTNRAEVEKKVLSVLKMKCGSRSEVKILPERFARSIKKDGTVSEVSVVMQYLETKLVYGYNTRWNLKRESVPAVAAGSCMAVEIKDAENGIPAEFYLGERQQEGFGHVLVLPYSDMKYTCRKQDKKAADSAILFQADGKRPAALSVTGKKLIYALQRDAFETEILKEAFAGRALNLSSTALGRATLMLRESCRQALSEYRDDKGKEASRPSAGGRPDPEQNLFVSFLNNFEKRYTSIKKEDVRKEVQKFDRKSQADFDKYLNTFCEKNEFTPSDPDRTELIYRFMLTSLTAEKYRKSAKKKDQKQSGKGGADR